VSAVTQTFKSLLEGMAMGRLNMVNASTGAVDMQVGDKVQLAAMLTDAMKTVWEMPAGKSWMWPWTLESEGSLTLTSGAIALGDLDYPRWVALYSGDPRGSAGSVNYHVPAYVDGDGIHPRNDALGSYFAFYIPRAPEFTHSVVAVNTAYAADAIVYDDRSAGNGGTGECFRCVTAYTTPALEADLTTDLANVAKWKVQVVHKNFRQALVHLAHGLWLDARDKPAEASRKEQNGMVELATQWTAVVKQQAGFMPEHWASGTWI
jgi:hypothetical protein